MSKYTPSVEALVDWLGQADDQDVEFPDGFAQQFMQSAWLAAHDADVRKAALEEARVAVEATVILTEQMPVPESEYSMLAARRDGGIDALRALDALSAAALGDAPTGGE